MGNKNTSIKKINEYDILNGLPRHIQFWPGPDTDAFRKLDLTAQGEALIYWENEARRVDRLRNKYFNVR